MFLNIFYCRMFCLLLLKKCNMLQFSLANCARLTTARKVWSGLKLTQTVTLSVDSDLLRVVVESQLNAYVFLLKLKTVLYLLFTS